MARSLRDCVIVITGASSGIGRATALAFAREGAKLVVAARRGEALDDVAHACDHLGTRCLSHVVDVTDEEAVRGLARRAVDEFGRIDVWVNNAAVYMLGRFEDTPSDAFRRLIEVNLFGYIHGARAALPTFRQQKSGVLINVASVAGKVGTAYGTAYSAAKFAIVGFSEALREELIDEPGIAVCTVMPASIDTPLFQHAANYSGRAIKPMPPVYTPEQVADTIVACARSPQREVYVGGIGRVAGAMRTVAPGMSERRWARQVGSSHFEDAPAEHTQGNLFHPVAHGTGVSGGWRNGPSNGRVARTMVTVGGLAAVGLGAWWLLTHTDFDHLRGRAAELAGTRRERHGLLDRILGGTAFAAGLSQLSRSDVSGRLLDLGGRAARQLGPSAARAAVQAAVGPIAQSDAVQEGFRTATRGASRTAGRLFRQARQAIA